MLRTNRIPTQIDFLGTGNGGVESWDTWAPDNRSLGVFQERYDRRLREIQNGEERMVGPYPEDAPELEMLERILFEWRNTTEEVDRSLQGAHQWAARQHLYRSLRRALHRLSHKYRDTLTTEAYLAGRMRSGWGGGERLVSRQIDVLLDWCRERLDRVMQEAQRQRLGL